MFQFQVAGSFFRTVLCLEPVRPPGPDLYRFCLWSRLPSWPES